MVRIPRGRGEPHARRRIIPRDAGRQRAEKKKKCGVHCNFPLAPSRVRGSSHACSFVTGLFLAVSQYGMQNPVYHDAALCHLPRDACQHRVLGRSCPEVPVSRMDVASDVKLLRELLLVLKRLS